MTNKHSVKTPQLLSSHVSPPTSGPQSPSCKSHSVLLARTVGAGGWAQCTVGPFLLLLLVSYSAAPAWALHWPQDLWSHIPSLPLSLPPPGSPLSLTSGSLLQAIFWVAPCTSPCSDSNMV